MDAETLYFQLRQLAETAPALADPAAVTNEDRRWLGRVAALIERVLPAQDVTLFKVSCDGIGTVMHAINVPAILSILHRALAKAELAAPAAAQGQFVAAGDVFSAMAAVTKVFQRAKTNLLVVDAYADNTLLTDFAITAPEGITFQVLCADGEVRRTALTSALDRWRKQFDRRPLEARLAPARELHDRIIVVDNTECWVTGQSFNAMGVRSPTYVSRLDPELADQKIKAYSYIWTTAKPL